MKTIILFLICLFTLVSCNELFQKSEYYNLPDYAKSNLMQGDTFVYESNDGEIDTLFCVLKIEGKYRLALNGTSGKEPAAYWEFQAYYLSKTRDSAFLSYNHLGYYINNTLSIFGEAAHTLPKNDKFIRITIGYYDRPRDSDRDFTPQVDWYNLYSFNLEKQQIIDIELNNKIYSDVNVYLFKEGYEGELKKLYVNKDYGVLKYELTDESYWVLK